MLPIVKLCRLCHQEKPLSEFSGGRGKCKPCRSLEQRARYEADRERWLLYARSRREKNGTTIREYQRAYRKKNKDAIRDRGLRYLYGISMEEFEKLAKRQAWRCAICEQKKKLSVDHDHQTGEIRGLLCASCNCGLGYFQDDPGLLASASSYLGAS